MKTKRFLTCLLALAMLFGLAFPAMAEALPFTDVKPSDWFYNDVKKAYEMQLINGRTETSFAPDANLTYAEAVKLAACMNQKYYTGSVTLENGDPWYSSYVTYAKTNGIITEDYPWNENATRAGYVEIFAHSLPDSALKAINQIADDSIPDVKKGHPQYDEIYKLYRAGVLTGMDLLGTFSPTSNIRRSEVAAILTRMMDPSERKSLTLGSTTVQTPALTVSVQPQNVSVQKGADAYFSVQVSGGTAPYTYQWYCSFNGGLTFRRIEEVAQWQDRFGMVAVGETGGLTIREASVYLEENGSVYYCAVTDAKGVTVNSGKATLTVTAAASKLEVVGQPMSVSVKKGESPSFVVSVSGGTAPYKYQWYFSTNGGSTFFRCEDAIGWETYFAMQDDGSFSTLTVLQANVNLPENGSQYYCVVTDAKGNTATSGKATLSVTDSAPKLEVVGQPMSVSVTKGDSPSFVVNISGGKAPYTFQWYFSTSGSNMFNRCEDAIGWQNLFAIQNDGLFSTLTVREAGVNTDQNGSQYYCVITDADGKTVTSDTVTLTVMTPKLTIIGMPMSTTAKKGSNPGFVVQVLGGTAPYAFQWYYSNNGGTSFYRVEDAAEWFKRFSVSNTDGTSVLTVIEAGEYMPQNGSQYYCIITDADGNTVTSNTVTLTLTD